MWSSSDYVLQPILVLIMKQYPYLAKRVLWRNVHARFVAHGLLSRKRAPKLADWLVPKNGKADLINRSAIISTQQEVLGL